jgi:hypothetical protein
MAGTGIPGHARSGGADFYHLSDVQLQHSAAVGPLDRQHQELVKERDFALAEVAAKQAEIKWLHEHVEAEMQQRKAQHDQELARLQAQHVRELEAEQRVAREAHRRVWTQGHLLRGRIVDNVRLRQRVERPCREVQAKHDQMARDYWVLQQYLGTVIVVRDEMRKENVKLHHKHEELRRALAEERKRNADLHEDRQEMARDLEDKRCQLDKVDLLRCAACLDLIKDTLTMPCWHGFCNPCLVGWRRQKAKEGKQLDCPVCRRPVEGTQKIYLGTDYRELIKVEGKKGPDGSSSQ